MAESGHAQGTLRAAELFGPAAWTSPTGIRRVQAFMEDLRQTLDKFAVPAAEQAEVKALVEGPRRDMAVGRSRHQDAPATSRSIGDFRA
jgi:hypothetical protein